LKSGAAFATIFCRVNSPFVNGILLYDQHNAKKRRISLKFEESDEMNRDSVIPNLFS
jgi:hypothetical protein